MKVSLYEAGGRLEGGTTLPGMTLTGPLLLSGAVTSPTEAVHKQYVDTAVTNLDAASIVSGTIATARLPALDGDITTSNSGNVVTLKPSGAIAGDYTKVTVDAKGRVTTGLSLTEADLPNLNWSKIGSDKPTTLDGYGITNGVSVQSGTLTGALTLVGNPTEANHAATKQYADGNIGGGSKLISGDIVTQVSAQSLTGFLRCNGGELSKTTYAALYAVVGDAFNQGFTQPGNGRPWEQQYAFNQTQTNDITGWTSGTSLPTTVSNSQVLVTKSRVYLLGGQGSANNAATVYTASINSDGTLGSWTTSTALPVAFHSSSLIVTKNRVYLLGGYTTTPLNTVYTAVINADGTLGTWTSGTSLPMAVHGVRNIVTKNRVYLLAGVFNSSAAATVLTAPINADGTLGVWTTDTPFPVAPSTPMIAITKNRVYVLGGVVNSAVSNVVYTAPINTEGVIGTWTVGTPLPVAIQGASVFVTKNRVYLFSGANPNWSAITYTAPINADGTIGTWTTGTSIPGTLTNTSVFATKGRIYIAGGFTASVYSSAVYSASLVGGLNDYSPYYDGTIVPLTADAFKLPDYSSYEKTSQYFFIKT